MTAELGVRGRMLIRVLTLLRTLSDGRYHSMHRLAADLGVTDRTIRRDIELLEAVGFIARRVLRDDGHHTDRTFYALQPTTHFQLSRDRAADADRVFRYGRRA